MSFTIENNKIVINEPVVDVEFTFGLRNELKELDTEEIKTIIIDMKGAHTLPSVIIGQLMFLKQKGIDIEITVYNDLTYTLFEDLGLSDKFNIKLNSEK